MNRINIPFFSLIIIIVAPLLVLGFAFGLLLPKYEELAGISAALKEKKKIVEQEGKYFSNLQQAKSQLKDYQPELSKIDSALPSEPFPPSLFDFIQKTGSDSGLILNEIGSFKVSSLMNSPNIKESEFSLSMTGSYEALKGFLSRIEESARLIKMEGISFSYPGSQTKGAGKEKVFIFNLKIKAFSY